MRASKCGACTALPAAQQASSDAYYTRIAGLPRAKKLLGFTLRIASVLNFTIALESDLYMAATVDNCNLWGTTSATVGGVALSGE